MYVLSSYLKGKTHFLPSFVRHPKIRCYSVKNWRLLTEDRVTSDFMFEGAELTGCRFLPIIPYGYSFLFKSSWIWYEPQKLRHIFRTKTFLWMGQLENQIKLIHIWFTEIILIWYYLGGYYYGKSLPNWMPKSKLWWIFKRKLIVELGIEDHRIITYAF